RRIRFITESRVQEYLPSCSASTRQPCSVAKAARLKGTCSSTKAEMTINDFATQQCLKTKHDKGDDTTIIPGKAGQLCEYSDEEFAVMYILPATKPARP